MTRFRTLIVGLTVFVAVSALSAVPALAQATTGSIIGHVLDATGSAMAGAVVTARNDATGLTRPTTTNAVGEYFLAMLPPGTYTVSAELPGFKKSIRKGIMVLVGTRPTLDFNLAVGQIEEAVEVTAEANLIETTKSELGGVVTPNEIKNLPLVDRTFASLSIIMPEARPVGNFDPTKTHVGNFGMNGSDGRALDVNVDGGDNKDNTVGSLLQNFSYESIQEFQVLQHRWTAEGGRSVGGVVNVVSKSGTNAFQGSAFVDFRNQDTTASDYFESLPGGEKTPYKKWQFGGSVGGPILKDKLYFFVAAEHFSEPRLTLVDPTAIPQLAAIPGVTPVSELPTPYDDTLVTAKIDQRIGQKQSLFYRFSFQKNSSPNDQVDNPANTDPTGGNTDNNTLYDFVVNHTYNVSSTKLNQFYFHFQDFSNAILGVTTDPNQVFPSVQTGANVNVPQTTTEQKFQFRDDFSWQAGSHGLKFGVNYIYTKLGGNFFFGANGYQIFFFDDPLTITSSRLTYPQGFSTPGAVREITLNGGAGDTGPLNFSQTAVYLQDDWRVNRKLTLNLGIRWDANINSLPDQTNNRTMQILQQLNDPRAREITGNDLSRRTPGWAEIQPRIGFAYDPKGDGRMVIRGGYGIFYDQIFYNLTLFSFQQTNPTIYQTLLDLTNSAVGVGQLANYVYGTPLPVPPPGTSNTELATGAFGRINDPTQEDPYVQKFSLGFQKTIGKNWSISSDFVHTLGIHESRVQNINPLIAEICNSSFPNSRPSDPRCVRGASSRYFDLAFVQAGLGAGRLEQINMIGNTNRSQFNSWVTTLKGRTGKVTMSLSYILAYSKAWGGQPLASYTGNAIAITPDRQWLPGEFGPTRNDERNRIVASGVIDLGAGFLVAPLIQFATARPYFPAAGFDIDGDGRTTLDRLCEGVSLDAVFAVRGNSSAVRALNPLGCQQAEVNSQRTGIVVDENGNVQERSGNFFNMDLRVSKTFNLGKTLKSQVYVGLYNLFNTENLSYADRTARSPATSQSDFLQPFSLYGPGFGPPPGRPFTAAFGIRFDF